MKPQELRIGNYVYYEHTTHIVSGVHGNKVYSWWVKDGEPVIEYEAKDISGTQVENPYMDVVSQYEPIPLTEEILLKCGFEHSNKGLNYGIFFVKDIDESDEFYLRPSFEGGFYWGFNNHNELKDVKNILYLHQLQNLYFTLTGEELKLK
jgi:hypothetical protein